jgi:2-polyprenyl-3-methyl-5-hydroxy-6-metoxy-1,4-benzoquinol methylase
VRTLGSFLNSVIAAFTETAPRPTAPLIDRLDVDALWRDGDYFWKAIDARPDDVRRALHERYSLVPSSYVNRYLEHLLVEHRMNPLAPLYIESELGAPARQHALLAELERVDLRVQGKRCLDVGCSNGSLLLAARQKGAILCVGVDVSDARLASARQLCEGSGVELLLLDLASRNLPDKMVPFDLIFCTDVLEHVVSIPRMLEAMGRHLAHTPDARIFVTVFNHLSAQCVMSEPHYEIPGMVLLDRETAAEIWTAVRGELKSHLDYEVEKWPDYASLVETARDVRLRVTPYADLAGILEGRPRLWTGYRERLDQLEQSTAVRLDQLPLSPSHRMLLRDRIRRYCHESLESHRAFEAALPGASDRDLIAFHMRYYAQPMRLLLSHE